MNFIQNQDSSQYYTKDEVLRLIAASKIDQDADIVFLLVCAIFIFLMQMGFAMLEAGTVRSKNSSNILLKNLLDTYVGAIVYYLIGYSLANDAGGGIIGQYHFASTNFTEADYLKWILQYSVCSNIPTIVAGSLAERTFVDTYMFFSLLMTGFVYPVAAAWIWGGGWLKVLGFHDFAGAGVVHLLGGTCGIVGTVILGPRLGVFGKVTQERSPQTARNNNAPQRENQDTNDVIALQMHLADLLEKKNQEKKQRQIEHSKARRRSNSMGNIVQKWLTLEKEEEDKHERSPKIPIEYQRRSRRSLSNDEQELKHTPKSLPHDLYAFNFTQQAKRVTDLMTIAESHSQNYDRHHYSDNTTIAQEYNTRKHQENCLNKLNKKLSIPHLYHVIDPHQKARMDKIRQEFPEFNMVDDRQLNQIMKLYDLNIKSPIRPSSVALIVQGTFFLWVCWLFYNVSASSGIKVKNTKNQPSNILMNTILSSAASCVSVIFIHPLVNSKQDPTNKYPVQQICNSLLVGLVSITGCCNNVTPWASIIIGLFGTLFYCLSCRLFNKLKIDDPLESSQIHAFGGLWGLIAVSLFDHDEGVLFTGNFNFMLLQLLGAFSFILWASVVSFLYFSILKKFNKFRVGHIYEITGMDVLMHGGTNLLSNEMINKIEERQRSIANANRQGSGLDQLQLQREQQRAQRQQNAEPMTVSKNEIGNDGDERV